MKVNARTKLIKNYAVTDASINDLQTVDDLTNKADTDRKFYADSICTDKPIEDILTGKGIVSCINKKGCRNKALTEEQKQNDRIKSKIRARIGHIFGFIENNMGGFFIRTKGKESHVISLCYVRFLLTLWPSGHNISLRSSKTV